MVVRRRLPSASYHSPSDEAWTRDTFADQMIAVHDNQHEAADVARHVAEKQISRAPFFVMDVPAVQNAIDEWQHNMERFQTFYALRCNADPVLAQLLAETNKIGFEVVNPREMAIALSLVDRSKIIFSPPIWTKKNMRLAGEAEVGTIVVCSERELLDASYMAPYSKILLAITIPGCPIRDECLGSNIGSEFEEAAALLKIAYETCSNFDGFAFNIDNTDVGVYFKAMKTVRELWAMAVELGLRPNTISVGGGFRFPKLHKGHFSEVCSALHDAVDCHFPQKQFPHLKLAASPGRFFATAAFSLCTTVIGKREVEAYKERSTGVPFYVYQTNEGIFGTFECRLADCEPECKPLNEKMLDENSESLGVIIGPSFDNFDVARKPFRSRQLSVGEWLLWENMGAYSMSVDDDCLHPIYYFTGRDSWELISKRRLPVHQELKPISDVEVVSDSEASTDEELDRLSPIDTFFEGYI